MIRKRKLKVYVEVLSGRVNEKEKKKKLSEDFNHLSYEQLMECLTDSRLQLLKVINHQKPNSLNALAKAVGQEQERVAKDVKFLEKAGFVQNIGRKQCRQEHVLQVNYDTISIEVKF